MARKRKIPAKKAHGIRDPLKHQELQLKKLKHVINNPPDKGGDQKVSYKLAQFMKLTNDVKEGKKFKKRIPAGREDKPRPKGKKPDGKKGNSDTVSKIRPIKQFANEADEDYLKRVNRMTTESLREAEYEAKYGVTVHRDSKGKISIKKRPKDEISELVKKNSRKTKKGEVVPTRKIETKIVKDLLKQAIQDEKEEEKKAQPVEEYKKDIVAFGEIVHGPPTISTIPRKAQKSETVPRPGQKNNLLLKTMLNKGNASESSEVETVPKKVKPVALAISTDLKGKRKDLSMANRRMIEEQQNKAIEMYKKLKKEKYKKE